MLCSDKLKWQILLKKINKNICDMKAINFIDGIAKCNNRFIFPNMTEILFYTNTIVYPYKQLLYFYKNII